ncbi:hypothetical protein EVG20_g7503 [Dentipellis fragilis]|uniref:Uncharacterized protein n=1 Tax=Dentipellis fragilis TaxID=205917 RepID=A0A4Y9YEB1_9AGAM|nr:hypothetical protein EVG20_g7503 [Dentipellis fragilis]
MISERSTLSAIERRDVRSSASSQEGRAGSGTVRGSSVNLCIPFRSRRLSGVRLEITIFPTVALGECGERDLLLFVIELLTYKGSRCWPLSDAPASPPSHSVLFAKMDSGRTPAKTLFFPLEPPPDSSWDPRHRIAWDYMRAGLEIPHYEATDVTSANDSSRVGTARNAINQFPDVMRSGQMAGQSADSTRVPSHFPSPVLGDNTTASFPEGEIRDAIRFDETIPGELFTIMLKSQTKERRSVPFRLGLDTGSTSTWFYGTGYCEFGGRDGAKNLVYRERPAFLPPRSDGRRTRIPNHPSIDMTGWDRRDLNTLPREGTRVFQYADDSGPVTVPSDGPLELQVYTHRDGNGDRQYSWPFYMNASIAVAAPVVTMLRTYDGILAMGIPPKFDSDELVPPDSFLVSDTAESFYIRILLGRGKSESAKVVNFLSAGDWPCDGPPPQFCDAIPVYSYQRRNPHNSINGSHRAVCDAQGREIPALVFDPESETTDTSDGIVIAVDSGSCHTWLPKGSTAYVKSILGQHSGDNIPPYVQPDHKTPDGCSAKRLLVAFKFMGMDGTTNEVFADAFNFLTGGHKAGQMPLFDNLEGIPAGTVQCLIRDTAIRVTGPPPRLMMPNVLGINFFQACLVKFNYTDASEARMPTMQFASQGDPAQWKFY